MNNRYKIASTIGQGGMGTVYRAFDRLTGQFVALKRVTAPTHSLELFTRLASDEGMTLALANEFRTLASLRHPHIISVLDYGFEANLEPFFTMRLLENALPIDTYAITAQPSEKIGLLLQILQALNYLHRRGILHRDLKPSNVLVERDAAYLLDFGLALDYAQNAGDAAGTLAYLAPEVLQGKSPSVQSDLYAFGVLAYEILTGAHPFASKTNSELINKVLLDSVQINSQALNDELATVLLRLLSKNPSERYATAAETLTALAEAGDYPVSSESEAIRESFLVAANFVGRDSELAQLKLALNAAIQAQGQAWLIAGESGVGKSRLMDELRSQALVAGAMVLRGQAVSEGGLPYQLWREIVRNLVLLVALSDEEAHILKLLVPDIETLLERKIPELTLDIMSLQKRLPLLLLNLLTEAAKMKPLVLLLEDLQWAAEGLEILKLVSQSISQSRILLVANYRSDESPSLPETLNTMQVMNLSRLTEQSIRQLSEAMLGEIGRQTNVLELIQRETEGNAFFIVEVVRALAEEAGALGDIGRSTLPAQIFAGGIKRIIERRLAQLPAWALPAAQVAAISGRQVNLAIIRQIMPNLQVETWLRLAADAAILTPAGDTWQFAHDKLREYLQAALPPTEKRVIHLQVAQAIEKLYQANLQDYVVLLVQHFGAAGAEKQEGQYALQAAQALLEANPRDARQYIKRALVLNAQEQAENPRKQLAAMQLLLAQSQIRLRDYEAGREALQTSRAIYEQLDDELGIAICKHHLGEVGFYEGKFNEALPILQEALTVLIKSDDWRNLGFCYMNIGIIYGRQGESLVAREYFEHCLAAMEKTGDSLIIAQALNNLAISYDMRGEWDTAIEIYQRSLQIRRTIKDKRGISYSLNNLAALAYDQKRLEDAKVLRLEALGFAREMGDSLTEANALDGLGILEADLGNFDAALTYFRAALVIAEKIKDAYLVPVVYLDLGKTEEKMGLDGKASFDAALLAASKSDILPNKRQTLYEIAIWQSKKGDKLLAGRILASISPDYKDAVNALEKLEAELNNQAFAMIAIDDLISELLGAKNE